MKKRIIAIAAVLLYCLLFCMPVFATEGEGEDLITPVAPEQFVFGVDQFILTEDEVTQLNAQAKAIYNTYGIEVFVTRNNAFAGDIITYAGETFGSNTGGGDGMVLALTSSQWYIYKTARVEAMIPAELDEQLWNAFTTGANDCGCISAYLEAVRSQLASKIIPDERLLPRLVDGADVLTDYEESQLLETLDEISERQQFDVAVATVVSTDGKDIMDYADDYYDYNGFGFGEDHDGTVLVVDMGSREWWVSTTGYGIYAITDAGREYMSEKFVPYMSDGDFYKSFETFATMCDDYVTQAKTGEPYDRDNLPKDPVSWLWVPGSMAIGAVPGAAVTGSWKSKLKSVRSKRDANSYFDSGISSLTRNSDVFLYRNVNRTRIVQESSDGRSGGGSSTHFGSSGTSHGGGGGRF